MNLLKILALLGKGDQTSSEGVFHIYDGHDDENGDGDDYDGDDEWYSYSFN